jgi:beta-glucosidase
MVLLKNDSALLPLDSNTIQTIAVFGTTADVDPLIAGGGSSHVNPPYIITPLQGITERAGANVDVQYYDLTRETGSPIPSDFFQTPQATPGLQAEYFNSTTASDSPVAVSTIPNLDLTWNDSAPAQGVNASGWSARFTGVLAPKTSGMYNLALTSVGGSRLYLDDKLVIENQGGDTAQTVILRKRLVATKTYNLRIEYSQPGSTGSLRLSWYTPEADFLQRAAAAAAQADVAIVVAGVKSDEGSDRQTLTLTDEKLINAVSAANPRTVVVIYTPAQVLMDWHTQVPAILLGWLPGQEAGYALADVLFGDVNPSGRLPLTIAKAEAEYPANTLEQYPGRDRRVLYSEGLQIGYRHFDAQNIEPLYPFGYGLSYTTFEYSNITITPAASDSSTTITVTADVKNTGQRAGAEVAQLYLGMPVETSEPPKQLKGFAKVALQPGETQTVTFTLPPADYSFWSAGLGQWVAYPGAYQVMVGSSSRNILLTTAFDVSNPFFSGETLQADSATLSGGAILAPDGYVNGLTQAGAAAQFKVTAKAAGEYNVIIRYASTLRPGAQNTPRTLSLYVNGVKQKQVQFPNLANWAMWDLKAETVMLSAGENAITYQFDAEDNGDVYLDAFTVVPLEPVEAEKGVSLALIFSLLAVAFSLFAVFMARRKRQ